MKRQDQGSWVIKTLLLATLLLLLGSIEAAVDSTVQHVPVGERLRDLLLDVSSGGGALLTVDTSKLEAMLDDDHLRGQHDVRDVQFVLGYLLTSELAAPALQRSNTYERLSSKLGVPTCTRRDNASLTDIGIELYIAASGVEDVLSSHIDESLPFALPGTASRVRGLGDPAFIATKSGLSHLVIEPKFILNRALHPNNGTQNVGVGPKSAFASSSAAKSMSEASFKGQAIATSGRNRDKFAAQLKPLEFSSGIKTSWDGCDDGAHFLPVHAIDGDPETRWAAAPQDPQAWLAVSLSHEPVAISDLSILWETAAASHFTVDVSNGSSAGVPTSDFSEYAWTTVLDQRYENQPVTLNFSAHWRDGEEPVGRFLRVHCLTPSQPSWGCSIWDIDFKLRPRQAEESGLLGGDGGAGHFQTDTFAGLHPHLRQWQHDVDFRSKQVDVIEAHLKTEEHRRRGADVDSKQWKRNKPKEGAEFLVDSMHFPSLLTLATRYQHGYGLPKSPAIATTLFGVLADGVRVASASVGKSAFRATRIDRPEDLSVRDQENVQVYKLEQELELLVSQYPLETFHVVPVDLNDGTIPAGSDMHDIIRRIQLKSYQLGSFHRRGQFGLVQNMTHACRHFNISFHYGKVEASELLASCYKYGHSAEFPVNASRAKEIYEYGADRGNAAAAVSLGQLYQYPRKPLKRNITRAIELYHQSETMVHAQYLLGALHFDGQYYRHKDRYIDVDNNTDDVETNSESPDEENSHTSDHAMGPLTQQETLIASRNARLAKARAKAEALKAEREKKKVGELRLQRAPRHHYIDNVCVLQEPKVINAVKAVQYLATAARYRHTTASFLLAQIYYEGRGNKELPGHYVAPNLGESYGHFRRIASQHSSASLEAAFEAYSVGNTSLALMLYLLHAEMGSTAARMNALFLLDISATMPAPHVESSMSSRISGAAIRLVSSALLRTAKSFPVIGPYIEHMQTPQLQFAFGNVEPSQVEEMSPFTRLRLIRRNLERGLDEDDHDAKRLLGDYYLLDATRSCLDPKPGLSTTTSWSTEAFYCLLEYHHVAFSFFQQAKQLQPNGQVPEDAPATHLKLARLCFFINFDCAIFTEMDVYAAEIESKLQSNHAAGHPSPRLVWAHVVEHFFERDAAVDAAKVQQLFSGPGPSTNFSAVLSSLQEAQDSVKRGTKRGQTDETLQPLDWIVPIMCSITSLTQCVLDAHWLPLPFKSVLVRVLQASGSIISPQQFTARDNDGWGLSSLVLFAISASVGAWYLHRNQHPPDRQP